MNLIPADLHTASEQVPWVDQGEGVSFKLLRVSPERGTWANLIRVSAGGKVERHRHRGAVQGWVLKGRWRYLEHEWVATPGSYIFEPENGVHTLVVEGEEMVTLFMIDGPIEFLDESDNVVHVETAEKRLSRYLGY